MTPRKPGLIGRAFIVVNRIFGAGALLGGVYLLGICIVAIIRGRSLGDVWETGAFGTVCALAGVVYLRAPLYRNRERIASPTPDKASGAN